MKKIKDSHDLVLFSKKENIAKLQNKDRIVPFVKWAGGKRQILSEIKMRLPKSFNRYYEPFVGGGALFLDLSYPRVTISDVNADLISVYLCMKDEQLYQHLVDRLDEYELKHNSCRDVDTAQVFYDSIRKMDQLSIYNNLPLYEKAARLIYLNKTCFNGLYRVNKNGYFNVPFSKKLPVKLYSKENLNRIHLYISINDVDIFCANYYEVVSTARRGDFIYFDPPYDKITKTSSFTSYSKFGFEENEQVKLAGLFRELSDKGVYCMLSNHNTELIRTLYSDFNIEIIKARRAINRNADGRGYVEEVIIRNYI